jgi:hypothetical protein
VQPVFADRGRNSAAPKRFIESGAVPRDGVTVDTTWEKVNRDGSRDKRYQGNRRLPIMQYGELTISTGEGFHLVWQTSRAQAATVMANALQLMRQSHPAAP